MSLNNKGMTVGYFIFFIVFFFIVFWYCYIMLYNNFNEDKIINDSKPIVETNYETDVKNATITYINDYYSDLNDGENIIIKVSTLNSYNYLKNYECTGYAIASKTNGLLNIEVFVKCPNYVSPNYNSSYE